MRVINFLKIVLVVVVFGISFFYADNLIRFIQQNIDANLMSQHPSGGFILFIAVAFITSLIMLFPLLLHETIKYITPALYPKEQKFLKKLKKVMWLASFLFAGGVGFGVFIVFNLITPFLLRFNKLLGITNIWDAPTTIMFVLLSCFYSGLIFQTPIVIYYLLSFGVLKIEYIHEVRKAIVILALVISAVITPPDVFSQIIFGLPILTLFEISVLVWRVKNDRRR